MTTPAAGDALAIVNTAGAITSKITRSDLLKGSPLPADTVTTAAIADDTVTNSKLSTVVGELGGAWIPWTPTLVGWSGTPTLTAKYKRIGKTVHIALSILGTSNNATTTFTLPSTAVNDVRVATSNNTGSLECVGLAYVAAGNNLVTSRRGQSGSNGEFFTGWTNSGGKNIIGLSMTYEEA